MPHSAQAVLGIDVGTTAVKAMLIDTKGAVLADAEVEQAVSVPRPGWAEQHPDMWWGNTTLATRKALRLAEQNGRRIEVAAIGLSGQMHSSVFLDGDGAVIRPALLWNDARTAPQRRYITAALGIQKLQDTVGNLPLEGFTAPKLLWLKQNEPENYVRLRTLLLPKDYIRYRLSGDYATEPSDAAGTLLYDVRRRIWSKPALEALGTDSDILPRVVESTEISGVVARVAADELGIASSVPIVGGGADNAAGAVGSGVVSEGVMQVSIGTSGAVVLPVREPYVAADMSLHTFCHCAPGLWYLMGVVLSAGSALRWLRDKVAAGMSYDALTAEAGHVMPGSDGLLFLPYLSGERTPHNDANARGVFFGLSLAHGRSHLTRAVIEGVCFALRDSLEIMRAQGGLPSEVRVIGGGARSRLWMQILANAFGLPIATVRPAGGGAAYGAALLAAVGIGMFGSIDDAARTCIKPGRSIEPSPALVARYNAMYGAYRQLYPALRDNFASLAGITAGQRQ